MGEILFTMPVHGGCRRRSGRQSTGSGGIVYRGVAKVLSRTVGLVRATLAGAAGLILVATGAVSFPGVSLADPPGGSVQSAHAPTAPATLVNAPQPTSASVPKSSGSVVEAPAAAGTIASASEAVPVARKKSARSAKAKAPKTVRIEKPRKRIVISSREDRLGAQSEDSSLAFGSSSDEATPTPGKKRKKGEVKTTSLSGVAVPAPDSGESGFWGGEELENDVALGAPTISSRNIEPMKAAIERYSRIVAQGGWEPVPMMQMASGTTHPAVEALRRRLEIEGDLPSGSGYFGTAQFDYTLVEGLQRYQLRNGLKPTGDLTDKDLSKNGTRTLTSLNVPAAARLQQLRINLERLQASARGAAKRYVLVNIPAQHVEAVNEDRVELRLNGVVGKPDRPSPLLNSSINQLKFNPVWTLPPTVVNEDLIPKGRKMQQKGGVDVLTKFGIDAYGGSGKLDPTKINWNSQSVHGLRYSQQPGKENPLGFVKIDFANPHAVYMHDTPSPRLFEKTYRAASSGCIRVQNVEKLAAWLLRGNEGWSLGRVLGMKQSGTSENVSLKKPAPLYWVYITAWVGGDGIVQFRRDLYKRDVAQGVHKLAAAY